MERGSCYPCPGEGADNQAAKIDRLGSIPTKWTGTAAILTIRHKSRRSKERMAKHAAWVCGGPGQFRLTNWCVSGHREGDVAYLLE